MNSRPIKVECSIQICDNGCVLITDYEAATDKSASVVCKTNQDLRIAFDEWAARQRDALIKHLFGNGAP